jgi:ABC-type dipeptide/oligopeptide/nickel transport system permease component
MVVFKILELLPASAWQMIAATLLVLVVGCILIIFAALLSDVTCQRVIRLVDAFAKLVNKDARGVHRRRHR